MVNHQNSLRQEKKYLIASNQVSKFEKKLISAGFFLNHNSNIINNIYLDDVNKSALNENIEGDCIREKYRIRFYNNEKKFILEKKIKLSSSGKKNKILLKSKKIEDAIKESEILNNKKAVIQNQYFRRYYVKGELRITIDTNLRYNVPLKNKFKFFNESVIEVKYNSKSLYFNILNKNLFSGLQLTKFSKYANGMMHFYNF